MVRNKPHMRISYSRNPIIILNIFKHEKSHFLINVNGDGNVRLPKRHVNLLLIAVKSHWVSINDWILCRFGQTFYSKTPGTW